MANTSGRPIGPLQYRVNAAGETIGVYDSQGNLFPTEAYLSGSSGGIRAAGLLTEAELAEVRAESGASGTDLGPKLQAALDAYYDLNGSDQEGAGGHGACLILEPGTWTWSTLQLRPGMSIIGLTDRFEVRVKQHPDARAPVIDILGRGQNQDVVGRRTAVVLERLDLNANGNLDSNGDPINCINLRVDPDNEGDDESANRTGLIAKEVQAGGASGWGLYNLKRGKMWLSMCQFAGNGLAPLLPNNKVGGLFSQGPDCFFYKVYCGNNGGPQMHIKSSATPTVLNIELGVSQQADIYPALWLENCTDAMVGGGGNCTGWILIEGEEDTISANEYDTECNINLHNFSLTFKDKTFKDANGVVQTLPGFIHLKNIRGVAIDNLRIKAATDDDIAVHHYTNRPTSIVYIQGARTRATFRCPLPPLDDWRWPAGAPEQWSGSAPTNTYDSITNKPDQLLIQSTDPTDTTHAHLFDRIRFLSNEAGIVGTTDGTSKASGLLGEVLSGAVNSGAAVSLTTATVANLSNAALTAGNWMVYGTVQFVGSGATVTKIEAAISAANSDIPASTAERFSAQAMSLTTFTGELGSLKIGPYYLKVTGNATRYINCRATFSAGTMTAYGYIEARRVD